eukprot:CAMPEP_0181372212 /NCGR_PEP_ID=MMETSP1106-20121128/14573_1 /TAXON_ID=81844 /ORGANISM="Mantoniella antarctica, Strain SL-175" /LENGTH=101 /DNA_ID=CAMNT_0023489525 /DNA_START=29 /DNA_END=330 /DNA_ORIENTATION=-
MLEVEPPRSFRVSVICAAKIVKVSPILVVCAQLLACHLPPPQLLHPYLHVHRPLSPHLQAQHPASPKHNPPTGTYLYDTTSDLGRERPYLRRLWANQCSEV